MSSKARTPCRLSAVDPPGTAAVGPTLWRLSLRGPLEMHYEAAQLGLSSSLWAGGTTARHCWTPRLQLLIFRLIAHIAAGYCAHRRRHSVRSSIDREARTHPCMARQTRLLYWLLPLQPAFPITFWLRAVVRGRSMGSNPKR